MRSLAALLVLAASAAAQRPPGQGVNFYSLDREIAIGRQVAAGMAAGMTVVHDPKLEAYVAKLGAALADPADSRFRYTFTIFDDRKPWGSPGLQFVTPADSESGEPVAVAGGAVFVPLRAPAEAPDEATFAFQLAHAMAHVSLRHATRSATRVELMEIGTEPLDRLPDSAGYTKVALTQAARIALPAAELSFARRSELQADRAAADRVAAAGYDPAAAIPFLETRPAFRPIVFSAHPPGSERATAVRSAAEGLPARAYTAGTGEFAEMKVRAAGK